MAKEKLTSPFPSEAKRITLLLGLHALPSSVPLPSSPKPIFAQAGISSATLCMVFLSQESYC